MKKMQLQSLLFKSNLTNISYHLKKHNLWIHPNHILNVSIGLSLKVFVWYVGPKRLSQCYNFSYRQNFKNLGTWLEKEQWSNGLVKGGSHFNLWLYRENSANKNDVIVLCNTFVTCSYLSHNHCFYKTTKKYFF